MENIQKLFYLGVKFPKLTSFITFITKSNFLKPLYFLVFLLLHSIKVRLVYAWNLRFIFRRGIELVEIFKNKGGVKIHSKET